MLVSEGRLKLFLKISWLVLKPSAKTSPVLTEKNKLVMAADCLQDQTILLLYITL